MTKATDVFRAKAPLAMRRIMRELGVNKYRAAAIMGNAGHESAGLTVMQEHRPTVPGSRGGYGWFQWTGPRRRAFEAWCAQRGLKPASDEANLGFLLHELKGDEAAALAKLRAASTFDDMVVAFEQGYERAGIKHYDRRKAWAVRALEAFDAAPDANPKSLAQSGTAKGAGTAAAGGAVVATNQIAEAVTQLSDAEGHLSAGTVLGVVIGILILAGAAYAFYRRWDDAGRPLPWRRDGVE